MWRFALRNLLTRPMRSLLSLLGLTVAIVGMVGLFSVAEGIDAMVNKTFNTIPGLVALQPGAPIPLFSRLPLEWGEELASMEGVHEVNPEIWSRAHIIEGEPVFSPPRFLFGTDIPSRQRMNFAVYREHIISGRFLEQQDVGTFHTVISKVIAEEFGKQVGDTLHVDGQDLEIIGIYHCGSLLLDVAIILDIGQVRPLARMDGPFVSAFYIEPDPQVDRQELARRLESRFVGRTAPSTGSPLAMLSTLDRLTSPGGVTNLGGLLSELFPHSSKSTEKRPSATDKAGAELATGAELSSDVTPTKTEPATAQAESPSLPKGGPRKKKGGQKIESGVEVRGSEDWAQEFSRFSADLDIFLLVLTSIGVTIAVLSIINTMLMSVTERFIEFGILKANGWTNHNVAWLIGLESAILGFAGGVSGSILGWAATLFVNANWSDRIHLHASPQLLLFGVGFSTALGILGGLYPAIWASRMMPMDAIRHG